MLGGMAMSKLGCILAVSMMSIAVEAHAEGPPPSRVEAVLDLSDPEATVETYTEAFADDDFIAVYFALDPLSRDWFLSAQGRLEFDRFVSPHTDQNTRAKVMDGLPGQYEHAIPQGYRWSVDVFHRFQLVLWSADRLGVLPIDFDGAADVESVSDPAEKDGVTTVTVDATDSITGPVQFLLKQSPAGRWRVLRVTARPGAADEAVFPDADFPNASGSE